MIHAGLPQHVAAAHALEAHQHVLQRVVERVPHVERAGHVGRRNDDAERLGVRLRAGAGAEGVGLFPAFPDSRLNARGVVGLFEHRESGVPAVAAVLN